MRPNIDLPWSIHGQVKDLADERDLKLTKAYELVLSEGLKAIGGGPLGLTEDQETALYHHLTETLHEADHYEQQELVKVVDQLPEYDILQRDRPVGAEEAMEELDDFDADVIEQVDPEAEIAEDAER